MDELRRLSRGGVEGDPAGLSQRLIRAAQGEEPSDAALQRTLAAVGAGSAVLTVAAATSASLSTGTVSSASSAGAIASAGTTASAVGAATGGVATGGAVVGAAGKFATVSAVLGTGSVKWLGIAAVGGAMALGTGALVTSNGSVQKSQPQKSQPQLVTKPSNIATPPKNDTVAAEPPARDEAPSPEAAAAPARASAQRSQRPESEDSQLAREVALIDSAREALAAGQYGQALGDARKYVSTFPRGHLLPEAAFLQMEAERGLGQDSDAKHSAQRLMRLAPGSPQAERAKDVLGSEQ